MSLGISPGTRGLPDWHELARLGFVVAHLIDGQAPASDVDPHLKEAAEHIARALSEAKRHLGNHPSASATHVSSGFEALPEVGEVGFETALGYVFASAFLLVFVLRRPEEDE